MVRKKVGLERQHPEQSVAGAIPLLLGKGGGGSSTRGEKKIPPLAPPFKEGNRESHSSTLSRRLRPRWPLKKTGWKAGRLVRGKVGFRDSGDRGGRGGGASCYAADGQECQARGLKGRSQLSAMRFPHCEAAPGVSVSLKPTRSPKGAESWSARRQAEGWRRIKNIP